VAFQLLSSWRMSDQALLEESPWSAPLQIVLLVFQSDPAYFTGRCRCSPPVRRKNPPDLDAPRVHVPSDFRC